MDVVKQRMQLGIYRNVGDCMRSVLRREGVWGLYRSMPTTMAMNLPFGSILVASNESLKQILGIRKSRQDTRALLPWHFLSAGLSGAIASACTQPLDVVKTRLQTQDLQSLYRLSGLAGPNTEMDCLLRPRPDGSSMREPMIYAGDHPNLRPPKYSGLLAALRTIR
eukprot:g15709.t1